MVKGEEREREGKVEVKEREKDGGMTEGRRT